MGARKLTEDQILEIYQCIVYGDNRQSIADRFGIGKGTVGQIATGRAHGYITGLKTQPSMEEFANGKPFAPMVEYHEHYITTDGVVFFNRGGKLYTKMICPQ